MTLVSNIIKNISGVNTPMFRNCSTPQDLTDCFMPNCIYCTDFRCNNG